MERGEKKGLFYPDVLFENIYEITPDFLRTNGVRGMLLDLDNTIAPYEIEQPTDEMNAWFNALRDAGVRLAFVSNNHGDRVTRFNRTWGIPQFCKAGKPSPKGMRLALRQLGLTPEETVSLGDQIFTDCVAAHRAGLRFYIVPPIRDRKSLFFRFKRFLERPFVRPFRHYRLYLSKTDSMPHRQKGRDLT